MTGPTDSPLWVPHGIEALPIARFAREAERRAGRALPDYDALHAWSVADPGAFWDLLWDFAGVIGDKGDQRLADGDRMPGARFFPEARLNYAENLLRRNDDGDATAAIHGSRASYGKPGCGIGTRTRPEHQGKGREA